MPTRSRKALVIQHDHVSPPGPIGDAFEARGYELVLHQVVDELDFHQPHVFAPFPSLDDYDSDDVLVTMGAPWSAYDETSVGDWVRTEQELLRDADARAIAVLGICFGGQLLAAAHGGQVAASPAPEVGWVTIDTDRPGLVDAGPWFQWHFDRWALPPDAVEIARNEAASQAFLLRRNLGLQFHPELTAAGLDGWLGNGGADAARARGYDPDRMYAETLEREAEARVRASALVDAFVDTVATR